MSVVLEDERKIDKRSLFVIVFFLVVFVVLVVLAYYASLNIDLGENVTEPIKPHMSPAIIILRMNGGYSPPFVPKAPSSSACVWEVFFLFP